MVCKPVVRQLCALRPCKHMKVAKWHCQGGRVNLMKVLPSYTHKHTQRQGRRNHNERRPHEKLILDRSLFYVPASDVIVSVRPT